MVTKNNKNKHGGARNYNNKKTEFIKDTNIHNLITSLNIAHFKNIDFNYLLTINYGKIGIKKLPEEYPRLFSNLIRKISDFYRHRNHAPTYIYVRESESFEHAHFLIFIANTDIRDFKKHLKRSIISIFGKTNKDDTNFKEISGYNQKSIFEQIYKENLKYVFAYLLKCVDKKTSLKFGISDYNKVEHTNGKFGFSIKPDNQIIGKRTGYSKNLSPNKYKDIEKSFMGDLKPAKHLFEQFPCKIKKFAYAPSLFGFIGKCERIPTSRRTRNI